MKTYLFIGLTIFIFSCKNEVPEIKSLDYPNRPNIVWIVVEDMSPEHLESYGGTGGKTPNLNALAAESLQYQNAFSTADVPSSLSFLQ